MMINSFILIFPVLHSSVCLLSIHIYYLNSKGETTPSFYSTCQMSKLRPIIFYTISSRGFSFQQLKTVAVFEIPNLSSTQSNFAIVLLSFHYSTDLKQISLMNQYFSSTSSRRDMYVIFYIRYRFVIGICHQPAPLN